MQKVYLATSMKGAACGTPNVIYEVSKEVTSKNWQYGCTNLGDVLFTRKGIWPVRLFEGQILGDFKNDDDLMVFKKVFIEKELPLVDAFEPNGQKILEQINRLLNIDLGKPGASYEAISNLVNEHLGILSRFGRVPRVTLEIVDDLEEVEDILDKTKNSRAWSRAVTAMNESIKYNNDRKRAYKVASGATWDILAEKYWTRSDMVVQLLLDSCNSAAHLSVEDLVGFQNPWKPLVEIWEMGACPLGIVGGKFFVYQKEKGAKW